MLGDMISVKRLADSGKNCSYLVEYRQSDGKGPVTTRSSKYVSRGLDDADARSKALKFAVATDTIPEFRAFIFNEVETASSPAGKTDRQTITLSSGWDSHKPPTGSAHESMKRGIKSYVCWRQNRSTGLGYAVVMSRLENGRLRSVSFQDHNVAGAYVSDEVRSRAERFLRGVVFESWRKQATNDLTGTDRDMGGNRRERALKHLSAFVEFDEGEKVDCVCGKNRSRGLMFACERCGAWEHAECQGFRSKQQIPAEYICSACLRAEREDVVFVGLDEQGELGNWKLEDLWHDAKVRDRDKDELCCCCGCEDNEDFEDMILYEKDVLYGTALAHPSCISAARYALSKMGKVTTAGLSCQSSGDRLVKSPKGNEEVHSHTGSGLPLSKPAKGSVSPSHPQSRTSRRAPKLDTSARGAKRLRSALTNGGVVPKQEPDKRPFKGVKDEENDVQGCEGVERVDSISPEASKTSVSQAGAGAGASVPDRRFNDAAVSVPIKKRRLVMIETVRSPSPPPRPPSPKPEAILAPDSGFALQDDGVADYDNAEDVEMADVDSDDHGEAGLKVEIRDSGVESRKHSRKQPKSEEGLRKIELQPDNISLDCRLPPDAAHVSPRAPGYQSNHVLTSGICENTDEGCPVGLAVQHELRVSGESPATLQSDEADGQTTVVRDRGDRTTQGDESNVQGDFENKDAGTTSSASQSRSRDARLHWDLNMDMEEWERPVEEDTGSYPGLHQGVASSSSPVQDELTASPDRKESPSGKIGSERLENGEAVATDDVQREGHSDIPISGNHGEGEHIVEVEGETSSSDARSVESKHHVEGRELDSTTKESSVDEYSDLLEAEHVDYDDSDCRNEDEGGSDVEERVESKPQEGEVSKIPELTPELQPESINAGFNLASVDDLEGRTAANAVEDLGDAMATDGGTEHEGETQAIESEMRDVAAEQSDLEHRESTDVSDLAPEEDQKADLPRDDEAEIPTSVGKIDIAPAREDKRVQADIGASPPASSGRRSETHLRIKSSGWDKLPEGFDKAEDALRAAKENPTVRSGRGSPWGNANGRGASTSPRGGPVSSRFNRGLRVDDLGDRSRLDDSWNRNDHQRGQRADDSVDLSPRLSSPRGRSHGRGGTHAARSRVRMEPWMEGPGGMSAPWGPARHPSPPGHFSEGFGPRGPNNAAARALLKVESSGFVVAPDGTLTKAGTSAAARGPPRAFQNGGRSGRGSMFSIGRGDGSGMNMAGAGMNLGGMRVSMGMGRGGMGMGLNMNMGLGGSIGMVGVGAGTGPGVPGRGGPGGRGAVTDRYSAPYAGRGSGESPGVEALSGSRRGRSHDEYGDNRSRREDRSVSPLKRTSSSRRSRSGTTSRSKSRTRSPKGRSPPPRPTNSSGSGGGVGGRTISKKRSHSPVTHKAEVRGDRESPPSRRVIPAAPKLPLPPPPPRSQRSPPAGLKRLSDNKKDGDRVRSKDYEKDRDRCRDRDWPSSRGRSPPRRSSPHVVHGSALMDERDRQLLAGIRHVSPSGARNGRSNDTAGTLAVTSSRDSGALRSPRGRVVDGAAETRRIAGEDVVEGRMHGTSHSAEHRSSTKESSRGDRELISRRDSGRERGLGREGGRDRDDERRDAAKSSYSSRDRDIRSNNSVKYYNREGDDDIAPRRRRPSP